MHRNWRACLKEPNVRSAISRRRGGIKSEVVQCGEANRVGVLVLHKCFAVPSRRRETRSEDPGSTAITSISLYSCVQIQDAAVARGTQRCSLLSGGRANDFEGLNRAVEVLVIDGVRIVGHPGIWSCHLVTDEENAIVSRVGLDCGAHCRASPGFNGRLLPESVADEIKGERLVDSNYAALTGRGVVILVALVRMVRVSSAFVRAICNSLYKAGRPHV